MMRKLVDAEIIRETEKAFLIRGPLFDTGAYETWFPKTQIFREKFDNGTFGDIYAEEWILEQKQDDIGNYFLTEDE